LTATKSILENHKCKKDGNNQTLVDVWNLENEEIFAELLWSIITAKKHISFEFSTYEKKFLKSAFRDSKLA